MITHPYSNNKNAQIIFIIFGRYLNNGFSKYAKSFSRLENFVVRCFAPTSGINEDPVTGSAHCTLTPLWYQKLGKLELDLYPLSKRTGTLKVKLTDDRVEIKWKTIVLFDAKLRI